MAKPEKNHQPDKIDALYQWISFELQQARDTLLTELRMSSAQIGSLYSELKNDSEKSASAVSQEIRYSYKQNQTIYDGLASMLTKEVGERINGMEEKLAAIEAFEDDMNTVVEDDTPSAEERIAAALEKQSLLQLVNQCLLQFSNLFLDYFLRRVKG